MGYWEWFRRRNEMRSGYFENGEQVGEWITCDKKGQVAPEVFVAAPFILSAPRELAGRS